VQDAARTEDLPVRVDADAAGAGELRAARPRVHAPRERLQLHGADARERERPALDFVLAVRHRAGERVAVQLQPHDVVAALSGAAAIAVVRAGPELRVAREVDEAYDVSRLALL